jgi:Cu(I)/Ag(I) efflux system membrane fusion protein
MTIAGSYPDRAPTRRARLRGIALFAVVLAAALAAALRLGQASAPAAAVGHDHAAAGAAAGDTRQPVHLAPDAGRRIGVTFAPVVLGPMTREIRTVAQVAYDETRVSVVAPKVDGWIERLRVNATGQPLRRGDPLFDLYSPMVVTAEQELLLARGLTRQVAAGSEDARAGAASLVDAARSRLLAWDVAPAEVEAVLRSGEARRTVTLRAPVSGIVVDKPVLAGQRIMAGEAVYRIADLSRVWLEGQVFEQDLPAAKLGQPVTAEFAALPGVARTGTIAYVYPALDPTTRTARIRIELDNPGLRLKPGMYATVRFTDRSGPLLSVPRSAVLVTGERTLAFVRRADGAFEPRLVTLGRATDDRLEILHGLAVGDTVVASATFLVDAESNLGTSLGGMGDMPGMDIRPPAAAPQAAPAPGSRAADRPLEGR